MLIGLTYQQWLYADGYSTFAFALYSLFFLSLMKLYAYRKLWISLKMFQVVLKVISVAVGLMLFFKLDTASCTPTLLIFSLVYYSLHVLLAFRAIS
jgi:hypothetical protein